MSVTVRIPTPLRKLTENQSEIEIDGKSIESIISISGFSLLITIVTSLFPSLSVTKIETIKALKYE